MTESKNDANGSLVERILAYLTVVFAGLAFIGLFAILLPPLFGVPADLSVWWRDLAMVFAMYGFPIAFLIVFVLIIWRIIANRRTRKQH